MMAPDRGQPQHGGRVDPPQMPPNVGGAGDGKSFATKGNTPPSLSTMQRIVRLAEKDDILLYATALFGILMPAVMYFFYRTMHGKYHAYQQRKKAAEQRKIARKQNKRSVTIFYCGGKSIKRSSYDLAEELDRFDPIVAKLSPTDIHARVKEPGKALFIFLVKVQSADESKPLSAFLEWLDEMRYERGHRSYFAAVTFAVFSVGVESNTLADAFHSKLKWMRGTPLYESPAVVNTDDAIPQLRRFAGDLIRLLKQFHCGAFDERRDAEADSEAAEDSDVSSGVQEESLSTDSEK